MTNLLYFGQLDSNAAYWLVMSFCLIFFWGGGGGGGWGGVLQADSSSWIHGGFMRHRLCVSAITSPQLCMQCCGVAVGVPWFHCY